MNRRLHVLSIVGNLAFGGDEQRMLAMAQDLDYQRFRLSVLILEPRGSTEGSHGTLLDEFLRTGAEVHYLDDIAPFKRRFSWSRSLRAMHQIASRVRIIHRLIREWGIDLIDARLQAGLIAGVPAAVAARRPSVVTLYDVESTAPYPGWKLAQQVVLPLATVLVTDSQVRLAEFEERTHLAIRRGCVIPNGVEPPRPELPRAEVLERLGVDPDFGGRIVCQISGLVPHKGHLTLVEAAARVLAEGEDAIFLLVGYPRGSPQYGRKVAEVATQLGISDRIVIRSYPGPIGDIWQLVDVHAHASYVDSLPNAILEGMSLGKACVATRIGGISEAVADEESGLLVEPRDAEALADALLRLLRDRELSQRLGSSARERYQRDFRREQLARALERLFEEVVHPT